MTNVYRVQELRRSGAAGPHAGRDHRSPLTESEAITEGIEDMHAHADETSLTTTGSNSTESNRETATESSGYDWSLTLDEYGFHVGGVAPPDVIDALDLADDMLRDGHNGWHTNDDCDHSDCMTMGAHDACVSEAVSDAEMVTEQTQTALEPTLALAHQAHDTRWPARLCDECREIERGLA